jgi:endonuclease YncB( thermonuclease family)
MWRGRRCLRVLALMALVLACPALADPIDSGDVRVIDGRTIDVRGTAYRLIGFDAPGTITAQCPAERELGARALERLTVIVATRGLDFSRVPCPCRPGTEGTSACNDGRLCATLKAQGRDVGDILTSEALAKPFICRGRSCPPPPSWCP